VSDAREAEIDSQRVAPRTISATWGGRVRRGVAATLIAAAAASGGLASIAHADGDPASDYLLSRQVFFSSLPSSSSSSERQLVASVSAANRAGFDIRVAVISSAYDLGSITALWRKPGLYARFLGVELSAVYKGRVLVVMPNGFGFNWPGHPMAAADRVLARVPAGSGPSTLFESAQDAVRGLAAASGIVLPGASGPATPPRSHSSSSGRSGAWVAGAVLAVVMVAGILILLVRRWRARSFERPEQPLVTASGRRPRLLWALPGGVVLCGIAVAAPIVLLRPSGHEDGVTAAAARSLVTPPARSWPSGRRSAPEFVLHDQAGRRVSIGAYRGRPVILTFIDPLCRNLCPLEAQVLNQVVRRLPPPARPEILAVSVDVYGSADRRSNLLQDVREWKLVPQWRWAVGTPSALAGVWWRYGVGVKVTTKRIAGRTINYVTHTEAAFVIDRSGHERAVFYWPFYPQDVESVLHQVA
jgi:cytochrome oxidase Cu insertion factor (SCO1/SenC/PrrC family)